MARIRREQAPALREGRSPMLDILMSVHGEWIAKMASGEKTGELRKTWPKNIPTPFRVRLYCTQVRREAVLLLDGRGGATIGDYQNAESGWQIGNGFVVGEFICPGRTIVKYPSDTEGYWWPHMAEISRITCLSIEEIAEYLGEGGTGSVWKIQDLKIYERPIELHRFFMPGTKAVNWAHHVERAPQSWCYIENLMRGVTV